MNFELRIEHDERLNFEKAKKGEQRKRCMQASKRVRDGEKK